ncbi:MAG: methyltransferase domain-containing protein [Actinobacteria bacterium]|nr:methyltransferase domain-containing protein [Actinomycetota bacterium]
MGTDHYFSPTPPSGDEPKSSYRFTVEGRVLTIATDRGVFARKGLDAGTEVLLDAVPRPPVRGNLLDLGCGTGAIALALATRSPEATVHAVDVNPRAVELCRLNAQRNGLSDRCRRSNRCRGCSRRQGGFASCSSRDGAGSQGSCEGSRTPPARVVRPC